MAFLFRLALLLMTFTTIACNNNDEEDTLLQRPPYNTYTDSIRQQPSNAALYYKRGSLLFQNNQTAYAELDLRRAWNLAKEERFALGLAEILNKKNPDSALYFTEQASRQLPQSIALQINRAKLYQQKGDLSKALDICNTIINRYPNQLDALMLKADILKAQNNNDASIAVLEQAYGYAPFDVELSYQLAFAYAEAKNAKALTLADSLIRMDTSATHAEPYYFKGLYYDNIGNSSKALDLYNEAIRHDYYFIDAYLSKGELLYQQKKWAEALKTFELAATVSPTYADAYYWIGKTQEAMGNKQEAKLNYQRAYGLDKSLTEAKQAAERLKE